MRSLSRAIPRFRFGILAKLLLFTTASLLVLGIGIAINSHCDDSEHIITTFTSASVESTQLMADYAEEHMAQGNLEDIERLIAKADVNPSILDIHLTDPEGRYLASWSAANGFAPVDSKKTLTQNKYLDALMDSRGWVVHREQDRVRIGGVISEPGRGLMGYILITYSLADINDFITRASQRTLLLTLVVILFSTVCATLFSITFVRPILDMVAAARKIGSGELATRVRVSRNDELGTLARSINQMTESLARTTISRDFFDNVIQSMRDLLMVVDTRGNITAVNRSAAVALGMSSCSDLIGARLEDSLIAASDDLRRLLEEVGVEPKDTPESHELANAILQTRSGDELPVLLTCSRLSTTDRELGELICLAKDISEQAAAAEADRDRMQMQLLQAHRLASLGTMAAGVAHELNNPLSLIQGYAELIAADNADDSLAGDIDIILGASKRMAAIIDHLRQFSRAARDEDWKEVEINRAIADSFILLDKKPRLQQVQVELDLGDRLPDILGDHNRLESVFQNLITNSIDAFEDRGSDQTNRISIRTRAVDTGIAVRYEDNAGGMDAHTVENLYSPFYTTKEVGKGTGLGMSIVHGIIQQHKAHIEVETTLGRGTVFSMLFPVPQTSNHIKPRSRSEYIGRSHATSAGKETTARDR